ncbi:hypothetical protein B8W69_20245 [Mycobacterium vulneris]|uniref:DUF4386 domain-containing protein n=1 Tax=Mycolicibacterium vulneris TaxID=547163 RepID=A0A1X2KUG9_9MYCO|nr:hypothetical protein [Mycolicibacterium vulneris]OSC24943.1 hypothetical protein B8W69_20245 [Mycolicibacterium vulneris]
MNDSAEGAARRDANRPRRGGSPLAALSLVCVGLLIGGITIGVAVGGVMPLPYGPPGAVVSYVRAQPTAVRIIAVATFASSVPLALYAAVAAARLRRLGAGAGSAAVALTGGALAAGALGLAGLLGWALSIRDVAANAAVVRALYLLVFLTGGPGHIVALGLLVGALAAPGNRLLPRPIARIGVATAALAEATTAVLIWPALGVILPIARVLALTWLMAAGVALSPAAQRNSAAR